MKISEVVTLESANKGDILLYEEGIFWKAYQQSAYLFHTQVCPYQVKTKYIKCIGKSVASIGFPDSSLPDLFKEDALLIVDEKKKWDCPEFYLKNQMYSGIGELLFPG